MDLSLHTSVSITAGQRLYLINTYEVEVTIDGVLQGTGSHGELEGLTLSGLCEQTMNQTTRERVTTTYAVDDRIDFVAL